MAKTEKETKETTVETKKDNLSDYTKKEELVDLAKPTKVEDKELTNLQATVRTIDRLTADVGRMETQKYAMLVAMQRVQGSIDKMRGDFMQKYGTDNINIQTGEIAYAPENPTPQGNGETDKKD